MTIYKEEFYSQRHSRTEYAAQTVLSKVMQVHPSISSAIDIGCGVGTWLNVLTQYGVNNVQGVDGPWIDTKFLRIPARAFRVFDFRGREINLEFNSRYDLAISLEVAEHIESSMAREFIRFLTTLSDLVLFSAAVPGQGGLGHINEQWPSYWVDLFREYGYVVKDILRSEIWDDGQIPWWYRQNIMLFTSKEEALHIKSCDIDLAAMPIVHPDLLRARTQIYTAEAFRILLRSLLSALERKVRPYRLQD